MPSLEPVRVMTAIRADVRSDSQRDQGMFMLPPIQQLLHEMGVQLNQQVTPALLVKTYAVWWRASWSELGQPLSVEAAEIMAELRRTREATLAGYADAERKLRQLYRSERESCRQKIRQALISPEAQRLFDEDNLTLRELLCHEPLAIFICARLQW